MRLIQAELWYVFPPRITRRTIADWTRTNPSSVTKGLNITGEGYLGVFWLFNNVSRSAEKVVSCSARIKHCLAAWSSSNDKSPFRLLAGEDFKFWLKHCTHATKRPLFVKAPHCSSGNTRGTGTHDTNTTSTASSDCKGLSPGHSIWSSITEGIRPEIQDNVTISLDLPVLQPKLLW